MTDTLRTINASSVLSTLTADRWTAVAINYADPKGLLHWDWLLSVPARNALRMAISKGTATTAQAREPDGSMTLLAKLVRGAA